MSAAQALATSLGPDPNDPTASELWDRQREVNGYALALREARWERDGAVRRAVRAGYPRDRISQITGLSRGRISQITRR